MAKHLTSLNKKLNYIFKSCNIATKRKQFLHEVHKNDHKNTTFVNTAKVQVG